MAIQLGSQRWIIVSLAALLAVGCGDGGGDGRAGNVAQVPAGANAGEAGAPVDVPDSCGLLPQGEIESAVGRELREGKRDEAPGGSSCTYKVQLGKDVTRTFPNPALPPSIGLTSVVVSTSAADPEAVAQVRALAGSEFEDVSGLGDDAYFLGPNLLHVRVGQRSLSVRINSSASSDADVAKVREVILTLGRAGASKL